MREVRATTCLHPSPRSAVRISPSPLFLAGLLFPLILLFAGIHTSCQVPSASPAAPGSSFSPSTPGSAQQLARRVDAYYNSLHSLRARFSESYDGMGIRRRESGTLLLEKPGRMRWDYAQPAGKVFLLDGKYGWFYSPGNAQVQRIPAAKLDDLRSPLRFLLGHTRIEKELTGISVSSDASGFHLSGVPKGMEQRIAEVTLSADPEGVIQSIVIAETDGARTSFTFSDAQPNAAFGRNEFVFHPPAGIPVAPGLPPI